MAVAFFIPDQATLLRKAREQEQQLLRQRHWQMATVVLNTLRQLMESSTSQCLQRAGRKCGKWRKPSQWTRNLSKPQHSNNNNNNYNYNSPQKSSIIDLIIPYVLQFW